MLIQLKTLLGKETTLNRFELLFGYKKMADFNDDSFADGKERTRQKIINDLVKRLTCSDHDKIKLDDVQNLKLSNSQYMDRMNDIITNSIYFKNEDKYRYIFFKSKGKLKKNDKDHFKHCVNTVQSILDSYNILLRIDKRIRVDKKLEYCYSLTVGKQLMDIVKSKYDN